MTAVKNDSLSVIPELSLTIGRRVLPEDLFIHACSFLSFKDLASLAPSSKRFRYVLMNNSDDRVYTPAVAVQVAELRTLRDSEIEGGSFPIYGHKSTLLKVKDQAAIFTSYHSLEVLHIYDYKNKTIILALQNCPKLNHLVFKCAHGMKDEELLELLPYCSRLRALDLGMSYDLTSNSLKAIIKHCPHLRRLCIKENKNIGDSDYEMLAKEMPELVSLNISRNEHLTDAAPIAFTSTRDMVDLDVSYTNVTFAVVESLSLRCSKLSTIRFSPKSFSDIPVELSNAPWEVLFSKCGPLQDAYLDNVGLTENALIALADRSPGLEKLCVSSNDSLTDNSLTVVASRCLSLRELQMTSCHKITDRTIDALHRLTKLELLQVDSGRAIPVSIEAVNRLRAAKPSLYFSGSGINGSSFNQRI